MEQFKIDILKEDIAGKLAGITYLVMCYSVNNNYELLENLQFELETLYNDLLPQED